MDRDYSCYEPLFGSWYITKKIGTGSSGTVFEISRTDEFGITLYSAMKAVTIPYGGEDEIRAVLFNGLAEDELNDYYEKIARSVAEEFRCLAKLRGNSHIVSYEDHQIIPHEDDCGWDILIRFELLTPLTDHYGGRDMTEEEVVRMGRDLCMGLESCSHFGILHRDIKPSNIFVADDGSFKLGDFGVARIGQTTQSILPRKGTYTYMAPEVYRGGPYTEAADIYSLGMVLYQCLNNGRTLFMPPAPETISYDDTEDAFARRLVSRDIPVPAHGSEWLKKTVQKALAFDPADRFKDAAEMRMALDDPEGSLTAVVPGPDAASDVSPGSTVNTDKNGGKASGKVSKSKTLRRIAASAAVLIAAAGIAVYALIPHSIESVEGIEDSTEIYIGDTLQPDYVIEPSRFADEELIFDSSDEAVAEVSGDGAIHAAGLGTAVITISVEKPEYSRTAVVNVVPKVTAITNIDDQISLETGSSLELAPVLEPAEFSDEEISWKIADESVVSFSSSEAQTSGDEDSVAQDAEGGCILTAVSAGETELTAEAGGCSFTAVVTVTDPPPVYVPSSNKTSKTSKKKKSSSTKTTNDEGYFLDSDKEQF